MAGASASSSGAVVMSEAWPGVRWNVTGRHSASVRAWIFVVRPPRERPIACVCSPLFRRRPSGVLLLWSNRSPATAASRRLRPTRRRSAAIGRAATTDCAKEVLELVKIEQLDERALVTIHEKAPALEKSAYRHSPNVYARTKPATSKTMAD